MSPPDHIRRITDQNSLAAGTGNRPFHVTLSSAGVEIPRTLHDDAEIKPDQSSGCAAWSQRLPRHRTVFPTHCTASVNNCAITVVEK